MKTGICSITFRDLAAPELAGLVAKGGLDAIEWGGDVHVPPGDAAAAQLARKATADAGLETSSYGSYYSPLDAEGKTGDFTPVLETALELGTDTLRIWAGARASEVAGDPYRKHLAERLRADLDQAAAQGVRLALEFHANTLTDSNAAALALLGEINHPNLFAYWQPIYWVADSEYRLDGLRQLGDRVLNLHVFHWMFHPYSGTWAENTDRRPLGEGLSDWRRYLSVPLSEGEHFALLEFVRDDSPEQFLADAAVLKTMLE